MQIGIKLFEGSDTKPKRRLNLEKFRLKRVMIFDLTSICFIG